ncbi:GNAT family N-acetyltransferase [Lacinutrix salivirga]
MSTKHSKINTQKVSIQLIASKQTHSVRHPVLRAGKPIEDCVFDGDDLASTFHLGLFLNKKLIGVATFVKQNSPLFYQKNQYRLRGMAVLKEHQGQHFGKQLIKAGALELKKRKIELLWFNARIGALKFYKNNGFTAIGNAFEIENIGTHYVMYKVL